jgi:prophage regulatory protein
MAPTATRFFRLKDVKAITGLSKSTIYERISAGSFPKQILIGPRTAAWLDSDIQDWIESQVAAARK